MSFPPISDGMPAALASTTASGRFAMIFFVGLFRGDISIRPTIEVELTPDCDDLI